MLDSYILRNNENQTFLKRVKAFDAGGYAFVWDKDDSNAMTFKRMESRAALSMAEMGGFVNCTFTHRRNKERL